MIGGGAARTFVAIAVVEERRERHVTGGLAATWHLARRGHSVVTRDAGPLAGGMVSSIVIDRPDLLERIERCALHTVGLPQCDHLALVQGFRSQAPALIAQA
jgi:hypothetical protein